MSARKKKWRGHIVAHTHWDRAWYWTLEQSRPRLVDMMDKLVALLQGDEKFSYFLLDGQVAMVEDYLEIRPEQRPAITELARAGRLLLGPLFVLPDLFIPEGESLVRNVERGRAAADAFGRAHRVAYLPDPFGLPEQLPQVLRQLGLDDLIFSRGRNAEVAELGANFNWQSPDGSTVLATCQTAGGYCNLQRWGHAPAEAGQEPLSPPPEEATVERAKEQLETVVERLLVDCPHGELLFNNGCDHLSAQSELPRLIEDLDQNSRIGTIEISSPERYQGALRRRISKGSFSPGTYTGELRGAHDAFLLSGSLSTRTDLKRSHHQSENLLLRWCEPMNALAGQRSDRALLAHAWKLLLLCQPHDNICGCSIDAVHADDLTRLRQSRELGETLLSRSLDQLLAPLHSTTDQELIVNPHPWPTTAYVPTALSAPMQEGEPVAVQEGNVLLARVALAPLGVARLTPSDQGAKAVDIANPASLEQKDGQFQLDNGLLTLRVDQSGSANLVHGSSGLELEEFAWLADEGDAGDSYDFCPPAEQATQRGPTGTTTHSALATGPLRATAEVRGRFDVPAQVTGNGNRRAKKWTLLDVAYRWSVDANSPVVRLNLQVNNRARDHRLRLALRLPMVAEVLARTPFALTTREPVGGRPTWIQPPSPTHPFQDLLILQGEGSGLGIVAPGLREYESSTDAGQTEVYLTLLRAVGWLSRPELKTRPGQAGPCWPVDAQQLGQHGFELAFVPFSGHWSEGELLRRAAELITPPRSHTPSPLASSAKKSWPAATLTHGCLELVGRGVEVSALRAGPNDSLEVRLVNLLREQTTASIAGPWAKGTQVRLDGKRIGTVDLGQIELGPAEIVTIRLTPRR